MDSKSTTWHRIAWAFGAVFIAFGVLNAWLIALVPGAFYLLVALFFLPPANEFLLKTFKVAIPPVVKIVLGLMVIWGSLAVGDLMELFEAWLLR
ncbi:MAG: hypothetical protein AAFR61_30975 [Bacteroidota bacterium]